MAGSPDPLFRSFFLGGFEASSHRRCDGERLDLLAQTGHDRGAAADYGAMSAFGIDAVRDGIRWHLVEATPGHYDFSSFLPMLRAANAAGVEVIWDLCHYGYPDDLDIWSGAFIDRFAAFAAATARVVASETDEAPVYCPINEISYWAWAGAHNGRINPCATGRAHELKRQLVRASIAAIEAVRAVDPRARFITAEPLIHVDGGAGNPDVRREAHNYTLSQFQATDMLSGRIDPELGGRVEYLEIVGVNFYPDNQWYLDGPPIPLGHHAFRPLRDMLVDVWERYRRPILMSETGAEGTARATWLHYVAAEVRAARNRGAAVGGICLYPVLDYPGWENGRVCEVGLLSIPGPDGRRTPALEFADELRHQQLVFGDLLRDLHPSSPPEPEPAVADAVNGELPPSPRPETAQEAAAHLRWRPSAARAEPPPFMKGPLPFILHYAAARPWQLGALLGLVVCAAGCAVGAQYVMKILVDAMAGPRDSTDAWIAVGIFVAVVAAEGMFWRLTGWLGCRTTVGVGVAVRLDLFDYLNGQPMRYFAENLAGALGQRITATAGNFGALINTLVWRITPPVVDFIGASIIFAFVDWRMMVALGASVALITAGLIAFGERGRGLHRFYAEEAGKASGELVDVITNMWAVKAFSARRGERARLAGRFDTEAGAQRRSWMYTEKARVIHDIALAVMAAAMLSWAVALWRAGTITPGEVVVVSALTFRILHGSRELALALVDVAQQFGFIEDTLRVIAQPQTVIDRPDAPAIRSGDAAITFMDVSFGYGRGGRDAVRDVNIVIPAGQKVGIVGPSGAGKSTLIQLLQRLYDADRGEIRIGAQPIAAITQESLRATLAVVPQEITLFHRTVRENILFARPDAREHEVVAAARAAACDVFVRRLPEGYDTVVGERGTRLSGGQRQRIGIARAFLKDAPIIVFDEATSALDTESEMEIQRAIVEHLAGRTVIAVAHRLSTLAAFDRVLVMVDGRIVEDGAPGDLLRAGGTFEHMWRLQAGGLARAPEAVDEAA